MKRVNWEKSTEFEGPQESPGFLLWQASSIWRRQVEGALAKVGLTHPQFVLLASLGWLTRQGEKVTQVELARHCRTDITMTSQVLRTLEKRELIVRKQRPGNERAKFPEVTESGAKLIETALPLVEQVDREFFSKLGNEVNGLVDSLSQLAGN